MTSHHTRGCTLRALLHGAKSWASHPLPHGALGWVSHPPSHRVFGWVSHPLSHGANEEESLLSKTHHCSPKFEVQNPLNRL